MPARPPFVSALAIVSAMGAVAMTLLALPALLDPREFSLDLRSQGDLFGAYALALDLRRWSVALVTGYFAVSFVVAARGLWQMRRYGAIWFGALLVVSAMISMLIARVLNEGSLPRIVSVSFWIGCAAILAYLFKLWPRMR